MSKYKNKNKNKKLECFICHKQFNYKISNLKRHIALHGPTLIRFQCKICKKSFQNKTNHNVHWRNSHQKKKRMSPEKIERKSKSNFA